jgi:transcriptional regulator with XRE-family HTH domain
MHIAWMSSPNERLRRARIKAGYATAAEAARAFGWNDVTYTSHENGARGITTRTAPRYAKAFHVATSWLLEGTGPESDREKEVVNRLRRLSAPDQDIVLALMESLAKRNPG